MLNPPGTVLRLFLLVRHAISLTSLVCPTKLVSPSASVSVPAHAPPDLQPSPTQPNLLDPRRASTSRPSPAYSLTRPFDTRMGNAPRLASRCISHAIS
ncbi:hypothetical protein BKA80DRAFT_261737 [Phyllosticta citrichinensis]